MGTFCCEFLGCKVNQYDAERARRYLVGRGFVEDTTDVSLILLASCTVTGRAAGKGRRAVRSLLRRHPSAHVAVLGCMTGDDRAYYETMDAPVTTLPSATDEGFLDRLAPIVDTLPRPVSTNRAVYRPRRTREYLKVEDGCDLACSFCVIPSVRGRARSRSADEVVGELTEMVQRGTREVVITGVHLGHYGRRTTDTLWHLLEALDRVPGDFRIRISSIEVSELGPELMERIVSLPRIVPHLHLPLQSGADPVLKAMRRPYRSLFVRRKVDQLRARIDDLAVTTDVIVGFPGETEEDFEATLALCRDARFSKIHQFPFSARTGTVAADLKGVLHGDVVRSRQEKLRTLEAELRDAARERRLGQTARVLVERVTSDIAEGYDERYHRVQFPAAGRDLVGELADTRIEAIEEGGLIGRQSGQTEAARA